LTGPGFGGGPHVKIFSGATTTPTLLASFLAFPTGVPGVFQDPNAFTGVGGVAFTDIDGDNQLDILVGTGRGPQSKVRIFRGPGFTPTLFSLAPVLPGDPPDPFAIDPRLTDGANVAGSAVITIS
jgi:hypothetical protein